MDELVMEYAVAAFTAGVTALAWLWLYKAAKGRFPGLSIAGAVLLAAGPLAFVTLIAYADGIFSTQWLSPGQFVEKNWLLLLVSLGAAGYMLARLPGRRRWLAALPGLLYPLVLGAIFPLVIWYHSLPYADLQAELDRNRQRWESQRPAAYTYQLSLRCFCPGALGGNYPVTVVVRGDQGQVPVSSGSVYSRAEYTTIESLFQKIQFAIDQRYVTIRVDYDPTLGYPTEIFLEQMAMASDDEITITVQNLTASP